MLREGKLTKKVPNFNIYFVCTECINMYILLHTYTHVIDISFLLLIFIGEEDT